MTIREALLEGNSLLDRASLETPHLDATLLLSEALGCTKEQLYASLADSLKADSYTLYMNYLELRLHGIPISYIRQRKEFYGLEFRVDERVLVPRPETEILVETALSLLGSRLSSSGRTTPVAGISAGDLSLHDVCTGSGCVAITLKHEIPFLKVSASDISEQAARVFEINSRAILGEVIPFMLSNLLDRIRGPFDLITCNPPYLKEVVVRKMKENGWPEPEIALNGGAEGLSYAEKIVSSAFEKLKPGGYLLLEADPGQMAVLRSRLKEHGFRNINIAKDLDAYDRVIFGKKPGQDPGRGFG